MRIIEVNIDEIQFIDKEVSEVLVQSIQRIGLSFPVKLNIVDDHYEVVDGHKRIKVMKQLGNTKVTAIVMNNGNSRSNDCWRARNVH